MVGEGYDGTHPDLADPGAGAVAAVGPPPLRCGGVIDHLALQSSDVAATAAFYLRVFAPAGVREAMRYDSPGGPVVGLCGPDGHPQLWLGPLAEGTDRPVHLAIRAPSREAVDEVFALARAEGVEVLHEPRVWPEYHPGYYGAFFRDPDGNNVEAVHHSAPDGDPGTGAAGQAPPAAPPPQD
jgi:catechol 2,3-dioxygenase-like lactoylglutathione lyase family enzyme